MFKLRHIQFLRCPMQGYGSFVHDIDVICGTSYKINTLLYQQNREVPLCLELQNNLPNVLHDRRLNAFCRLIKEQQPRTRSQCPGKCQLLLLSTTQIPPAVHTS